MTRDEVEKLADQTLESITCGGEISVTAKYLVKLIKAMILFMDERLK